MPTDQGKRRAGPWRRAGLIAIILGAALVLWARYGAGAPGFIEPMGLGLMVCGWAAFAVALILKRRG